MSTTRTLTPATIPATAETAMSPWRVDAMSVTTTPLTMLSMIPTTPALVMNRSHGLIPPRIEPRLDRTPTGSSRSDRVK